MPVDILTFMSKVSDGTKQNTKKLRFALLTAFLNFIKNLVDQKFQNPCDNPALRKFFKAGKPIQFKILGKEVVDEIIFRTRNPTQFPYLLRIVLVSIKHLVINSQFSDNYP
jgi:hypothetical protein